MMSGELASLVGRLEAVTTHLESLASRGGGGGGGVEATTEIVEEFDSTVLGGKLKKYFELSAKIGGEVAEHAQVVRAAFNAQRAFLVTVSTHKAPKPDVFQKAIKPLSDKVNEVQAFCDKRRGNKMFSHFMTIKEGIGCMGWVTVAPKPGPYVKEMFDQSLFYGNRVIKDYKGKDDTHVEWVRAFTGAILELQGYVKKFHTTGLTWNPAGAQLSGAPPPPPGGAPPPPPPPPIQPPSPPPTGRKDDAVSARANLLADLSKGGGVTKGLRKVTNEMKTYKNPELRASSVVKATEKAPPTKAPPKYGAAAAVKKPPVFELQGKKWVVEYQEDNRDIQISNTNMKQNVYIYRCTRCTITIKGKVNGIIVDSSKRVALVFDDVISSVEVINTQNAQVQIMGKCPTVSIDKTDGCLVYLSKESLNAEIVTAKSSEMNVCIPKGDEYSEFAVPEQYKTRWNGKTLVTTATDING